MKKKTPRPRSAVTLAFKNKAKRLDRTRSNGVTTRTSGTSLLLEPPSLQLAKCRLRTRGFSDKESPGKSEDQFPGAIEAFDAPKDVQWTHHERAKRKVEGKTVLGADSMHCNQYAATLDVFYFAES